MTAAAITLTDVTKRFGSHVALDSVSLEVLPGTAAVVLGPSGCGKTTMLRIIAGLEVPDSGQVAVGWHHGFGCWSRPCAAAPAQARIRLSGPGLWPHLTVRQNLDFVLGSTALSRPEQTGEHTTRSRSFALRSSRVGILTSSQAESSSASHSRARLFLSLACCCWTSPSRAWTQNSAQTCDRNSPGFSARSV